MIVPLVLPFKRTVPPVPPFAPVDKEVVAAIDPGPMKIVGIVRTTAPV